MATLRFQIRDWLVLARVSNLPAVWSDILAAWLLAGGRWNWHPLAWLVAGGSLIYTGGMILNDAADVKFDREFRKERPLPSGRVSVATAWTFGIASLIAGFAMMVWGAEACIWLTGALIMAIVAYDFYHKPWVGSVFIMGSCRTLLFLSAASAVTGTLNWSGYHEVIVKAVALGGYVVGLSLVARYEASPAKSNAPNISAALLMLGSPVCSGMAYSFINQHSTAGLLMSVGLALFLWMAVRKMKSDPPKSIGPAVGILLSGIILTDALAVSSMSLAASIALACVMPLALLWQRFIAAT